MSDSKILNHDPLGDTDEILRKEYYGKDDEIVRSVSRGVAGGEKTRAPKRTQKAKPTHYKVVCISLYTRDIENLEATVAELKRRGYTKANKSQLIRMALGQLDIEKLPPPTP